MARRITFEIIAKAQAQEVEALNEALKGIKRTMDSLTRGQRKTIDRALGLDEATSDAKKATKAIKGTADAIEKLGDASEEAANDSKKLEEAQKELIATKNKLAKATDKQAAKDEADAKKAIKLEEKKADAAEEAAKKELRAKEKLEAAEADHAKRLRDTKRAFDLMGNGTDGFKAKTDELSAAIKRQGNIFGDLEDRLSGHLSKGLKNGSQDVETLRTEFRQLGKETSKVDGMMQEMKGFPEKLISANKRYTEAMEDAREAQSKLMKAQQAPNKNIAQIDEANRAYLKAKSTFNETQAEIDGLNKRYRTMGETVEGAQRRVAKLRMAMETTDLGELVSPRDINRIETLEDSLDSLGNAFKQYVGPGVRQLDKLQKSLNSLGGRQKQFAGAIDGLQALRKELVAIDKFKASELMKDIGNPRAAINATTSAMRQQTEEAMKLVASTTKLAAANAKFSAAEKAKTAALQNGRRALEQQKRIEQLYGGSVSDAKSARSTLDNRNTQLLAQENQLLERRRAILISIAATRQLRDTAPSRDSEQYARATTMLKQYTQALQQNRQAQTMNAANQRQNTAAMNAATATVDKLENSYAQMRAQFVQLRSGAGINVFREMARGIEAVNRVAIQLVNTLSRGLHRGISMATQAAHAFTRSVGSGFAGLQRSVQGIGRAFSSFGDNVSRSMDRARSSMLEFYAAGYSLMTVGSQIQQFGNQMWRGMSQSLGGYMEYEQARTQAGIAGAQPTDKNGNVIPEGSRTPVDSYQINSKIIDSIIFDLQRGNATPSWLGGGGKPIPVAFDAKELANGLYYYSSAIGAPITEQNRGEVSDTVATIMQMAKITNTGIETATKGVLNAAMEFGFDPRAVGSNDPKVRQQAAMDISKIAAQMGYLANISSMEVSDIVETFKMVGPQAHFLSPGGVQGEAGAGLDETFMLAFLASEVGLRGGNVGRGINQAFTSLLDPTDKMLKIAGKYWGEGGEDTPLTKEEFNAVFKNEDNSLKGGISGFLRTLSQSVPRQDQATMLAELFTSNATRGLMGPVLASGDFDIDKFLTDIEENPFKWMEAAVAETANTVSGWFTFMKNGWMQFQKSIIGSVSGPLMNGMRLFGELMYEVAERVNEFPAIGRGIAAVVTAVASLASVLGTLMVGAGAILLLGRSFAMLGGMVLPFLRILMMAGLTLFGLLPILALVGVAVGLLAAAFKNNAFGIRDGWESIKYAFENFDDVIMPAIDRMFTMIGKIGSAFMQFINGILLGVGPIDNLAKALTSLFGPRIGGAMMEGLLMLSDALEGTREQVKSFMSAGTFDASALSGAGLAIQGFFEQVLFGRQRLETVMAQNAIGEMFGIENLSGILANAAQSFRSFMVVAISTAIAIGRVWFDLTSQIRDNLVRALSGGQISQFFTNLRTLVEGVIMGLVASFTILLGAINFVVGKFADLSTALNAAGDSGVQFMGMTITLEGAIRALGMTIGLYFGARMVMMFTPLGAVMARLIPILTGIGAAVIGVTGRFVVFGAQVGIAIAAASAHLLVFLARMAMLATINTVGMTASASFQLLSASATGASAGVVRLAATFGALNLAMFGVVGVMGLIAVGIYAFVAATQGFDQANAMARAFFTGLVQGASLMIAAVALIVKGIAAIVSGIARLTGMQSVFQDGARAAQMFGMAMGVLATRAVVGSIVMMIARFTGLNAVIGNLGKTSLLRFGMIGVAILLIAPHLDTIIGKIGDLIGWFNQLQIAGVGAGDAIAIALGGAAASSTARGLLGKAAGPAARGIMTAGRWAGPALATPAGAGAAGVAGMGLAGYAVYAGANQPDAQYISNVYDPYQQIAAQGEQYGDRGAFEQSVAPRYQKIAESYRGMGMDEEFISNTYQTWLDSQWNARQSPSLEKELASRQLDYYQKYGYLPDYLPSKEQASPEQLSTGSYVTPKLQSVISSDQVEANRMGASAILSGSAKKKPEQAGKHDGADYGGGWNGAFIASLKNAGMFEEVSSLAKGMGFNINDLGLQDVNKVVEEAMKMPELTQEWAKMDWSYLGPKGKSFQEATDNWENYEALLKATNGNVMQARQIFKANFGFEAPTNPPNWDDYFGADSLDENVDALGEAAAAIGLSMDNIREAFGSLKGMSTADFLNAQSPTGTSFGGLLAGDIGDTILGNIPEGVAPWMNKSELLMDAAGSGVNLAAAPGGKNMHRALSPYLEITAAQSGLTVDELLVDVPKFHAPEEFVGIASADIAMGISEGLTRGEFLALDTLGADAGIKGYEAGMNWAELTDYAVGQAVEGHDWNLTDFLTESWGYTVDEANAYLASHSIDPNSISSGIMEATEIATMTGNGAFDVMTEEMYSYLAEATNGFTSNVISMTASEWAEIPPAYKAVMKSLGITTIIADGLVPPEALEAARAGIQNFADVVVAGADIVKAGSDNYFGAADGILDAANEISQVGDKFKNEAGEWMVTVEDFNGTQITIPAAEYDAFLSSLDTVNKALLQNIQNIEAAQKRYAELAASAPSPQVKNLYDLTSKYTTDSNDAWVRLLGGKGGVGDPSQMGKALGMPEHVPVKLKVQVDAAQVRKDIQAAVGGSTEGAAAGTANVKVKIDADTTMLGQTVARIGTSWTPIKIKIDADTTPLGMTVAQIGTSWTPIKIKIDADTTLLGMTVAKIGTSWTPVKIKIDADTTLLGQTVAKIGTGWSPLKIKAVLDFSTSNPTGGAVGADAMPKVKLIGEIIRVTQPAVKEGGAAQKVSLVGEITRVMMAPSKDAVSNKVNLVGNITSVVMGVSNGNGGAIQGIGGLPKVNLVGNITSIVMGISNGNGGSIQGIGALPSVDLQGKITSITMAVGGEGGGAVGAGALPSVPVTGKVIRLELPEGFGSDLSVTVKVDADITTAAANIAAVTSAAAAFATTYLALITESDATSVQARIDAARGAGISFAATYSATVSEVGAIASAARIKEARQAGLAFATNYNARISVSDGASSVIRGAIDLANQFDGMSATATIRTVNETVFKTSGKGPRAARGGRIGSVAMEGRKNYTNIVPRATGGSVAAGEYTLVGEQGPELVKLPTGSFVNTARKTSQMLANSLPSSVGVDPSASRASGEAFGYGAGIMISEQLENSLSAFATEMQGIAQQLKITQQETSRRLAEQRAAATAATQRAASQGRALPTAPQHVGVYNQVAGIMGRSKGSLGGAIIGGWEMLMNGFWRSVKSGAIQKGILAEDGTYVNPGFYAGRAQGGVVKEMFTLINERGGELVTLPTGSIVHTARESENMLAASLSRANMLSGNESRRGTVVVNNNGSQNTGDTFNFYGDIHIGDKKAGDEFFAEIDRRQGSRTQLARRGMVPTDDMRPFS